MSNNSKEVFLYRDTKDDFKTPNIKSVNPSKNSIEIELMNFRSLKSSREYILFYFFNNKYYFPYWFEFRSINNNLLFLFVEYELNKFSQIVSVLKSSLQKEEHIQSEIRALVISMNSQPDFCYELDDFFIESEFLDLA